MTTSLLAPAATTSEPPSRWRQVTSLVLLHLTPGVGVFAVFALTAPALDRHGLPPIWGLLAGVLLVTVPLGLVLGHGSSCREVVGRSLVPDASRSEWRLTLTVLIASILIPGVVVPLEEPIRSAVLPHAPAWFSAGLPDLATYSTGVQLLTLTFWFVAVVVVGPIVEEVYYRGYLLHRLPGSAATRCLVGATLFSLYHFWQPQAFLTVVATSLPLYWVVLRTGRLMPAVVAHVGANAFMFVVLAVGILGR